MSGLASEPASSPAANGEQQQKQEEQQQGTQGAPGDWALPVERRSELLTEELNDCVKCLWDWTLCGGPKGRLRQLYVYGKLQPCMEEYQKLKCCLTGKMQPQNKPKATPQPHPIWEIRTRQDAAEFWAANYAHMGAKLPQGLTPRATEGVAAGSSSDGSSSGPGGSSSNGGGGS